MRRVSLLMHVVLLGLILALVAQTTGCAPSLIIKSEPSQASVFWINPTNSDKKDLGKTPLQVTGEALRQIYGSKSLEGEAVQLVIEKPGFTTQNYLVPATPFGTLSTTLMAKLSSGIAGDQTAHEVLSELFKAQKFALQKDYERALIAVDKILEIYPDFAPAHSMKGSIAFIRRDYPQALKDYEAALKADSNWDEAIEMISHIKQLRGETSRVPASKARTP